MWLQPLHDHQPNHYLRGVDTAPHLQLYLRLQIFNDTHQAPLVQPEYVFQLCVHNCNIIQSLP
jgi:hypothetical protein